MELKQMREEERRAENEKRKQKMIEAAFSCFSSKGMEAASIADIAGEAGFGEATVYRYFSNKETIALECGKWFWETAYDFMTEWSDTPEFQAKSGMEQMESLIRRAFVFYQEHRDGFRLIHNLDGFLLSHKVEPEQLLEYERAVDGLRPCLCDAIEKGMKDGSISSGFGGCADSNIDDGMNGNVGGSTGAGMNGNIAGSIGSDMNNSVAVQELYYAVTTGIMSVMQKQAAAGSLLASDRIVDSDKKLELFLELLIAGLKTVYGTQEK